MMTTAITPTSSTRPNQFLGAQCRFRRSGLPVTASCPFLTGFGTPPLQMCHQAFVSARETRNTEGLPVKATVAAVGILPGRARPWGTWRRRRKTGACRRELTGATTSAALPETDDGAEGSRPAISVGSGIRAVAPEDHGQPQ